MEPLNAAAVALSLPEIVSEILAFHFKVTGWRDPRQRFPSTAALRVNRLWFECGIEKLWAIPSACVHLRDVPPERRQIYASHIRCMNVWYPYEERCMPEYMGLEFRRLEHYIATVPSVKSFDIYQMKPYCVRSLESFDYNGSEVPPDILELLQKNCPNLQYVRFHTYEHPATTASFTEWIRRTRLLESFFFTTAGISAASTSSLDGDLLLSLACSNSLNTLCVPWEWTLDAAEYAAGRLADLGAYCEVKPFPSLERLFVAAPSNALGKLASMLRNLSYLRLTVQTVDADAIEPLRELVNLTTLDLTFRHAVDIPAASLAGLATLSKLQTLELKPLHPILTAVTSFFSDEDLELVASHWPRLRSFIFVVRCGVTAKGFRSLALHCRELRRWETCGPLKVNGLFTHGFGGGVLFPQLQFLRFEGFEGVV